MPRTHSAINLRLARSHRSDFRRRLLARLARAEMTFRFTQDCDSASVAVQGVAMLDANEYAELRACPQCDRPAPTYGDSGWAYFVECPKCSLRTTGRPIE